MFGRCPPSGRRPDTDIVAKSPRGNNAPASRVKGIAVTVKTVVFDAYGALFDIQPVASITEESFPGYGEIVTQIWPIKQLAPLTMFKAIRMQMDELGLEPDYRIQALSELPKVVAPHES